MRSHVLARSAFAGISWFVLGHAQTLTITIPSGPTIVEILTTNESGLSSRTTIATVTASSTPFSKLAASLASDANSTRTSSAHSTSSSINPAIVRTKTPVAVIAGVLAGAIVVIVIVITLLLIKRRKNLRTAQLLRPSVSLDPVGSPVADKRYAPDSFPAQTSSRRQRTPTSSSDSESLPLSTRRGGTTHTTSIVHEDRPLPLPRIVVTTDGSVTINSGTHDPAMGLSDTSTSAGTSTESKSAPSTLSISSGNSVPPSPSLSSPSAHSQSPSSPVSSLRIPPPPVPITQRHVRTDDYSYAYTHPPEADYLTANTRLYAAIPPPMPTHLHPPHPPSPSHHPRSPVPPQPQLPTRREEQPGNGTHHVTAQNFYLPPGADVADLQRQIAELRRQNDELRITEAEDAPPAYDDVRR